ncbi:hypothetical protein P7K49_016797 [Saguinus oedipus]|uniref:Uncharacterized protein n=1 Tax=Saguinus oedipus TaxID=9490 RepID=A0ABQ9VD37_SAGOE|nr:hypothetical protein P7K49_016797 [Saguinus oedipus]
MWLDHRAVSQVNRINETKHSVLQYVGGVMSVEMQAPKLLWLKEPLVWGNKVQTEEGRESWRADVDPDSSVLLGDN